MNTTDRIKWKNGNGEMIGFAVSIFLLFIVMVALVTITTYSLRQQQLTVSTYCAGRAAAVSQTKALGENRANAVLKMIYNQGNDKDPLTASDDAGSVWMEIETVQDSWVMGNFMTITVKQSFPKIFPFEAQTQTCKMTMLIEGGLGKK